MKYCGFCGGPIEEGQRYCAHCGRFQGHGQSFSQEDSARQSSDSSQRKPENNASFIDRLNDYVGNDRPADLNWRVLFTDVFKRHSKEEAEDIFICGTRMTTPHLKDVSRDWPHPWLYSRVFVMFLLAFFLLWVCCAVFGNTNALPGFIVVGSFAVPLATMVLFLELNAYRDISLYQIIQIFLVGGCASLVATLFIFSFVDIGELNFYGALMTGIIEELGKALIVCYFISNLKKMNILGGMLIGAAVGAGFAAFESAGYALQPLMAFMQYAGYSAAYGQQLNTGEMLDFIYNIIILRGFLAPGGHVAWAAISGAALVIAAKGRGFVSFDTLTEGKFLRLFAIPVILHTLWDSPLAAMLGGEYFFSYIALSLGVWIVLLILINMGLAEVNRSKDLYQ